MTCKDCAYFKLVDSTSDSGCYVSPAQVYQVWVNRPICANFKPLKKALQEEEAARIEESLWTRKLK